MPSDKGSEFTVIGQQKYIELGETNLSDTLIYFLLPRGRTEADRRNLNTIWRQICTEQHLAPYFQSKLSTQTCKTQRFPTKNNHRCDVTL